MFGGHYSTEQTPASLNLNQDQGRAQPLKSGFCHRPPKKGRRMDQLSYEQLEKVSRPPWLFWDTNLPNTCWEQSRRLEPRRQAGQSRDTDRPARACSPGPGAHKHTSAGGCVTPGSLGCSSLQGGFQDLKGSRKGREHIWGLRTAHWLIQGSATGSCEWLFRKQEFERVGKSSKISSYKHRSGPSAYSGKAGERENVGSKENDLAKWGTHAWEPMKKGHKRELEPKTYLKGRIQGMQGCCQKSVLRAATSRGQQKLPLLL